MSAFRSFLILSTIFVIFGVCFQVFQHKLAAVFCGGDGVGDGDASDGVKKSPRRPKYILYIPEANQSPLTAVDVVLQRLGLEKIDTTGLKISQYPTDWDLFWNHDHHVKIRHEIDFKATMFTQKMNHFPGNYVLVSKSVLATQTKLKFIPPAFLTSQDVQAYAKQHPTKRFVMKLKSNRGVKLVNPEDMDFKETETNNNYFAQEFIEDPLLWHGHKFDLGVYVAITSVNPLRLYYYTKDVSLRFCPKPYNTSNPDDVDAYVIGNGNLSAQKFKGTRDYVNGSFAHRDAFEEFLRKRGEDPVEIWKKVEELIVEVVMMKEKTMVEGVSEFMGKIIKIFLGFYFI
jgi:tubulin monoglycylase TTLL15